MDYFNKKIDEVEKELDTSLENGLKKDGIDKKREKYGFNELEAKKKESIIIKFFKQFKDFMIIILIIAAIVSAFVGVKEGEGFTDSIIIMVVVIVNAIIGLVQENKAEKSLEALQKLSAHASKVVRNGKIEVIPARELVPGDIVVLETGDYVPADIRLTEAINLKVQESALTGESVPIEKMTQEITDKETSLGDRKNMAFSSSMVTYGRGKGIVTAIGMNTEVGKIAGMLNEVEEKETPLQKRLNELGKTLGIVCLAICAVIFFIGLAEGKEIVDMFMTAVSLAVAAIPEGLAAVSTIVLAIGMQRMVKKNAIVKKLPAVETLGGATVICSDKTGTLTQNKMTVKKLFYNSKLYDLENAEQNDLLKKIIYANMLCNDTKIGENDELTGDPTETALTEMGFKLNYGKEILTQNLRVKEVPFDSERKLMTTVNRVGDKYIVYTKGGVDELLARCNAYEKADGIKNDLENYKNEIYKNNEEMAKSALRVLSCAYKVLDKEPTDEEMKNIENGLIFLGMCGMIDPPRPEVKLAVEKCKSAGIKTVMITGDHKITAIAIAKELGILENDDEALTGQELEKISDEELTKNIRKYSVYARVSPEHKVRIVKAWQKNGEIVAMTGDGVNDAPALKTSDIGCAMGKVGTDVAKEAADVILTDDNFATIVSAVEEGRRIYDNILKVIQFLLSSNIGEIVVLLLAILLAPTLGNWFGISDINAITPLLAIHILWINLVTDSLPALALAVDPPDKNIMNRKPRDNSKGIFRGGMVFRVLYQGAMIGIITLLAFIVGLASSEGMPEEERIKIAQTMSFVVLAFSELVHVFNVRNNKESVFKTGIFNNKQLIIAILIAAALVLTILFVPALRDIFGIAVLPSENVVETILLVISPLVIVEILKLFKINTLKNEE